ncbi:MAG: chromosomal replication initiator protein DnaA [Planctomycetes bacterium]|nr:chromosomal replication initiator protein DnaA [Planctomycetota bacterium]
MHAEDTLSWDELLRAVRADYPDIYRAWFEDLQTEPLAGGELRVRVEDPARAAYLRDRCTQPFVQTAMGLSGRLISVSFLLPPSAEGSLLPTPPAAGLTRMPLSVDYTFDQFVVGPANRLAHAACRAICKQPGTLYNPLFIHGASGLGKTHLLQAACAALAEANPPLAAIYVSCEAFVNDFVRAIETGELQPFRASARRADVLVIDDIQYLAQRESSQEELFHTFNVLYQSRRQIVLSADSPPSQIPALEERLVSRFNWGLVAQIDPPDRETRHAILQKKARLRGYEIPDEVLDFVAEHVESNIRLLEGALTKLISESQITGAPLTIETARRVLAGLDGRSRRPVHVSDILQAVSQHFGIRLPELLGRKRTRSVTRARQLGMYLARKLTSLSLEEIGVHFGGRDHSTVLHAERVVETERIRHPETAETVSVLTRQLLAPH